MPDPAPFDYYLVLSVAAYSLFLFQFSIWEKKWGYKFTTSALMLLVGLVMQVFLFSLSFMSLTRLAVKYDLLDILGPLSFAQTFIIPTSQVIFLLGIYQEDK